jgi:hypothetical protein
MVSATLLLDTAWSCLTLGAFGLMAGLLAHEGVQLFRRRTLLRPVAAQRIEILRPLAARPAPAFPPVDREPAPVQLRSVAQAAST